MPQVEVPPRYRGPTHGESRIAVDADTVRGCIEAVEARYPGFLELVFDADGSLRRYVKLFVDDVALERDGVEVAVSVDARIAIVASMAGG